MGEWLRGGLGDCPYAAEAALIDHLFEAESRHATWRKLDPRDPRSIPQISRELTGTDAVDPVHRQLLWRVLFQIESAGHRQFEVYELHREVRTVRKQLTTTLRRQPSAWELVSEAVRRAEARDMTTGRLADLHTAYQGLATAGPQELGARSRLAEQVYRLGASLCVDGCRGCLHRNSPLMPDAQTAVTVSRKLLEGYREFVLEPVTTTAADPGGAEVIDNAIKGNGFRRLLVAPQLNDLHAAALRAGGFTHGVYDPLLRRVVWVRES